MKRTLFSGLSVGALFYASLSGSAWDPRDAGRRLLIASILAKPKDTQVMVKQSRYSYSDTVAKLSKAMVDAGNTVFATIDQSGAAMNVGLKLQPTSLIIFGNPKAGTPFMEKFPLIGLDLPLKLLVWEDTKVNVAYVPLSEIALRYGVTGMDAQIANVDRALDTLTNLVI
jgi:uncharacterized protein (DUF302 family)